MRSKPEEAMAFQIQAMKLPPPVREYRFHETRRWRFDFAYPDLLLAIEVEGTTKFGRNRNGTMRLGRHQTATGFQGDCEKYNTAAERGWLVMRYTSDMIKTGSAAIQIKRVYDAKQKQQIEADA